MMFYGLFSTCFSWISKSGLDRAGLDSAALVEGLDEVLQGHSIGIVKTNWRWIE